MNELSEKILKLKKEKNAVILAHYYQDPQIQDVADFIGDSLALSYKAAETTADIIVFAGVSFMAETAKVIAPEKKVLIPEPEAGCSLADQCPADRFAAFKKDYPEHLVITYVNCSAEIKAMSDIVCTSSNALKIINSVDPGIPVLFAPDKNLGRYLREKSGRDMVLWDGSCIVHEAFSEKKILQLKAEHPGSKIIAHPECAEIVILTADFIGSTGELLNYVKADPAETFIVVTESGILHQMIKQVPDKTLIPAPPSFFTSCNCSECPYMRMNSLEKIYNCLLNEKPEVSVNENVRVKAMGAIDRMFKITEGK
jgi:quinolinate synthase